MSQPDQNRIASQIFSWEHSFQNKLDILRYVLINFLLKPTFY